MLAREKEVIIKPGRRLRRDAYWEKEVIMNNEENHPFNIYVILL
jgi:hypothetical protein